VLNAVKKGLIEGVVLNPTSKPEFCEACTQAKAMCQPFSKESQNRTHTYSAVVHTDLWGPGLGGYHYYMSFTDDFSHETTIKFLKLKSEALTAFKQYKAAITWQHPGTHLHTLHSDHGGKYLSAEFDQYLLDQGITCQLTMHNSPHRMALPNA